MNVFPIVEQVVHATIDGTPLSPNGALYVAAKVPADLNVAWVIGSAVYCHSLYGLTTKTTTYYIGVLSREPDTLNPTIRIVVLGSVIPDTLGKPFSSYGD